MEIIHFLGNITKEGKPPLFSQQQEKSALSDVVL